MTKIPFLTLGLSALCILSFDWLPLALLTPIRNDLGLTVPQMGAALGWFGLLTFLGSVGSFWLRQFFSSITLLRGVLLTLSITAFFAALFPYAETFIVTRLIGGCLFGSFWTVSTAASFSLDDQNKRSALSSLYVGNAVTLAFILPLAVTAEKLLGWRIMFGIIGVSSISVALMMNQHLFKRFEGFISLRVKEDSFLKVVVTGFQKSGLNVLMSFVALGAMFAGAACVYPYFRVLLEHNTSLVPEHFSYIFALEGGAGIIGVRTLKFIQDEKPSSLSKAIVLLVISLGILASVLALLTFQVCSHRDILTYLTIACWGFCLNAMAFLWPLWLTRFNQFDAFGLIAFKIGFVQLSVMTGTWLGAYAISFKWGLNFTLGGCILLGASFLSFMAVKFHSQTARDNQRSKEIF